jgi:hypothetical protein
MTENRGQMASELTLGGVEPSAGCIVRLSSDRCCWNQD